MGWLCPAEMDYGADMDAFMASKILQNILLRQKSAGVID